LAVRCCPQPFFVLGVLSLTSGCIWVRDFQSSFFDLVRAVGFLSFVGPLSEFFFWTLSGRYVLFWFYTVLLLWDDGAPSLFFRSVCPFAESLALPCALAPVGVFSTILFLASPLGTLFDFTQLARTPDFQNHTVFPP